MAMLAPHALQPGSHLGRYELVRFLGEGGFAEVWLGRHADDPAQREVAIKVVRRGRVATASERAMFLDEANIAASIRHENVARVFTIGDEEGTPYLVMEHVSGGSLEAVVRGAAAMHEPLPIGVAVALVAETCAGLHAAHELVLDGRPQHVVHRDVSPQNILITESGVPKLIDFGIAKARERISKQTSTGIAKGKIAYMSPEQARGEAIDRRADVWAIAAVAYELLEGRKLLGGSNEVARLQLLVSRPVRPTFARTPERIAAVIKRALSFRAKDRQETADEFRKELEAALAAEGIGASAEEIAAYCKRARVAADLAAATVEMPEKMDLDDLLPAGTAPPTVSSVDTPTPPRRSARRIAVGALAAIVVLVGAGVAIRAAMAPGESHETPGAPPTAASIAVPAPSAAPSSGPAASASADVSASAAPATTNSATSAPKPAQTARTATPPKPTTKPKPPRHPAGYDQIE